jgi:hypothetical protein
MIKHINLGANAVTSATILCGDNTPAEFRTFREDGYGWYAHLYLPYGSSLPLGGYGASQAAAVANLATHPEAKAWAAFLNGHAVDIRRRDVNMAQDVTHAVECYAARLEPTV